MRVSQVMVEFEKRVSDGNYGSEKATAQYVALLEDGEDPNAVIRELVQRGRDRVVGELSSSESVSVRLALNPPKPLCGECGAELVDEDIRAGGSFHTACRQARDQRRAREQQEREENEAAGWGWVTHAEREVGLEAES